jgi:NIMA (never in mitosis gene a)-related kinase
MSLNDFEIIRELGKGAYGSVFQVRRKEDGSIYAMKKVDLSKLNNKEKENSLNEVRILASITSPNVISYKDSFYDEKNSMLCIVMEFADNGDLEGKVNANIKARSNFKEHEIWNIVAQIAYGLKALHDKKIMHRDLKCANIFLTKNNDVKIGDMNVSKVLRMGMLSTQTGTPYYASPEVWKDRPYDYKSDIWSFGCIIYEMCTSKPPFRGNSMEQVYNKVIKGSYEQISPIYTKELKSLIHHLLQVSPLGRPNIDQVIALIQNTNKVIKNESLENNFSITQECINLLNTIRLPKNISDINNLLPKPKYHIRNIKR